MLLSKFGVSKHDKLTNLDYASAGHTDFAGTGTANTFTAKQTITVVPSGSTFGGAPLVINPASAGANYRLLDVGLNGADRFYVDEDGDATFKGRSISIQPTYKMKLGKFPLNGNYHYVGCGQHAGLVIGNYEAAYFDACRTYMGEGVLSQISLSANINQDVLLIKRDVDGGSSYSEAGALLTLQRDVTNVTSEDGNFLELQNAAGGILTKFDKDGAIAIGSETGSPKIDGDNDTNYGRLFIQPSSGNYKCSSFYMPSGTATQAIIQVRNDSDMSNSGRMLINIDGATAQVRLGVLGNGTAPTAFEIGETSGSALASMKFYLKGSVLAELTDTALGFFAVTPQSRQAHIVDADGTLADITTKFNTLLANFYEGFGFGLTA